MLISFEGIDGSGKSTQISLLKDYLTTAGKSVHLFREPGGTNISESIRSILLNPEFDINPVTELLLFSSARSQLISMEVIPLLNAGDIVILDRFYDSTVAYQGYGRESKHLDEIHQINRVASHHIVPDVTFYLRLSWDESKKRTEHMQKDRMEKSGDAFFERVIQGYDDLAKEESRYKTIDATLSREQIHAQILEYLSEIDPDLNF